MKKKLLALLLSGAMILSLTTPVALAEEPEGESCDYCGVVECVCPPEEAACPPDFPVGSAVDAPGDYQPALLQLQAFHVEPAAGNQQPSPGGMQGHLLLIEALHIFHACDYSLLTPLDHQPAGVLIVCHNATSRGNIMRYRCRK